MIRVNDALEFAKMNGRKVTKIGLGRILFAGSNEHSITTKMQNLTKGKMQRVDPEWCLRICEYCGCTLNFLFGIEDETEI